MSLKKRSACRRQLRQAERLSFQESTYSFRMTRKLGNSFGDIEFRHTVCHEA